MKKIILLFTFLFCVNAFSQSNLVVQNNTSKGIYITTMVTTLQNPNNIGSNVFVGYVSSFVPPNTSVSLSGISSDPTARWFMARLVSPDTREYAYTYFDAYQSPRNRFLGLFPSWNSNTFLMVN